MEPCPYLAGRARAATCTLACPWQVITTLAEKSNGKAKNAVVPSASREEPRDSHPRASSLNVHQSDMTFTKMDYNSINFHGPHLFRSELTK